MIRRKFPAIAPLILFFLTLGISVNAQKIYWGNEVPPGWIGQWADKFLTVAEKSGYERTTSSEEVLEFLNTMKWNSECVQVINVFTSELGRVCSALVLANPRVNSPAEARRSGKPVIYLQGNIHPPETEGKEALLMVMRDILIGKSKHLLDNQIIIICPNFCVDGNDALTLQQGTPHLIGSGTNSKGFNLNRDAVKLESTDVNGLYKNVLNPWDPVLFFDAHAMDRVKHAYAICYATCNLPAASPEPRDYIWNSLFPAVRDKIRTNFGLETFTHCLSDEENWPPTIWSHDKAYWFIEGKFLANAYGLRNRMSVLVETPGHPSFERKIYAQYAYISELVAYTNDHGKEMMEICRKADEKVGNQITTNAESGRLRNFVQGKYESWGKVDVLAYEKNIPEYIPGTSAIRTRPGTADGPPQVIHGVEHMTKPVGTKTAAVPSGYLIPKSLDFIIAKLRLQNIRIDTLKTPLTVSGEEFLVDSLRHERWYGFSMTRLIGRFTPAAARTFATGTFIVNMAQPMANLAFFCLEPETPDGYAGWGLLDPFMTGLAAHGHQMIYPVFKFFEKIN
jgi:hypothetical protein